MSKKYTIDMISGETTAFDSQVVETMKLEDAITIDNDVVEEEKIKDSIDNIPTTNQEPHVEEPHVEEEEKVKEVEEVKKEEETPEEFNALFFLAKQLQEDGVLPESFEINESITYADIYSEFRDNIESPLTESVKEEVYAALREQGINEHDLSMAKALRAGISPNLLYEAGRYEYYSSIDLKETADEVKKQLIEKMWVDKNYGAREIERLKDAIEIDESLDEDAQTAQEYFAAKYAEFEKNSKKSQAQQEQFRAELAADQKRKVRNIFSSKILLGDKLTDNQVKVLEKSWTEATEVAEVQGQNYKVTSFQKFLLEFNNDVETQLFAFKKYMFRGRDEEELQQVSKSEVEEELMRTLKAVTLKDTVSVNNKNLKKEVLRNSSNKKSYIIG